MRKILTKKEVLEVIEILDKDYPDARCELNHQTPFELLVATILSAQCTDIRVNKVTAEVFKNYNKPEDFVSLSIEEIENLIKTCGFYRNKAKSIWGTSNKILSEFNGEVPNTIEKLMSLPGVGKKTANVVASNAFGIPAIAVDTHVFRVSNRIGIVNEKNVEKTEEKLQKQIPKELWSKVHHILIFHGRYCCSARSPKCRECNVSSYCRYYREMVDNGKKNKN